MDELLKDFLNESSEQLEAIDSQLVRFEREPSDARIVANIFRLVHVIKSACGFLNLQRLERVAYSAETLIIRLRDGATPDAGAVALMLATIDRIKFILRAVSEGRGEPPGDDDRLIAEIESAGEARREAPEPLASPAGYVCEGVLGSGTTPTERRADSVRVSLDALERLTSLVSELVLTRNQLVAAAGAADFDRLRAPLRRLSTVTADLRSGLQAARMLPIARLFANLQRLVRGLSAETGKKVELTLRGGETEVDRQLIEAIRNPLTQIIRNAVAHAIEPLEERRRMGKPEVERDRGLRAPRGGDRFHRRRGRWAWAGFRCDPSTAPRVGIGLARRNRRDVGDRSLPLPLRSRRRRGAASGRRFPPKSGPRDRPRQSRANRRFGVFDEPPGMRGYGQLANSARDGGRSRVHTEGARRALCGAAAPRRGNRQTRRRRRRRLDRRPRDFGSGDGGGHPSGGAFGRADREPDANPGRRREPAHRAEDARGATGLRAHRRRNDRRPGNCARAAADAAAADPDLLRGGRSRRRLRRSGARPLRSGERARPA